MITQNIEKKIKKTKTRGKNHFLIVFLKFFCLLNLKSKRMAENTGIQKSMANVSHLGLAWVTTAS